MMTTYTNKNISFDNEGITNPSSICIEDIARSLSRQIRYNGHRGSWTVACHCLVLSYLGEDESLEMAMAYLLHDATESYIGDIPAPVKHLDIFKSICDYEDRMEDQIHAQLVGRSLCCYDLPLDKIIPHWEVSFIANTSLPIWHNLQLEKEFRNLQTESKNSHLIARLLTYRFNADAIERLYTRRFKELKEKLGE